MINEYRFNDLEFEILQALVDKEKVYIKELVSSNEDFTKYFKAGKRLEGKSLINVLHDGTILRNFFTRGVDYDGEIFKQEVENDA